MILDKKFLTQLQQEKIKNDLQSQNLVENYLYINGYKMLFIIKSKKTYKLLASSACHFEPMYQEAIFDVIFESFDLFMTICMFQSYVIRAFDKESSLV